MTRRLLPLMSGVVAAILVASAAERWLDELLAPYLGVLPNTGRQLVQFSIGTLLPWCALALLVLELNRRVPVARGRIGRFVVVHGSLLLLYGAARSLSHILVFHDHDMRSWRMGVDNLVSGTLSTLPYNAAFYAAVVAVQHAAASIAQLRQRDLAEARLAGSLAAARLDSLRARLQPHFLFNALQSINLLVLEQRTEAASEMLARLGSLLRLSIDDSHTQLVPLEHELALLDHYLAIEHVRFADRLRVSRDIAPEAAGALVPTLLLQPLVENAIRHGLARCLDAGRIAISVRRVGANVELEIWNDGPALAGDWQDGRDRGVGLATTISRLDLLFPGTHRFEMRNAQAGGVVVKVTIPWRPGTPA